MHTNHPRRLRRILIAVALTGAGVAATATLAPSASASTVYSVTAPHSEPLFTLSKPSYVVGETVKVTVTFPGHSPKPTGTVFLSETYGTVSLSAPIVNGKAILTTRLLPVGLDEFALSYGGDSTWLSADEFQAVTITQGATATTGAVRTQPVLSGTAAVISSLSKRISPATGGVLSGTTTFTATRSTGDPVTATLPAGTTGSSSWKPKLADGTWTVTAAYSGNGDYTGSTSAPFTVQVGPAAPAGSTIDQQNLPPLSSLERTPIANGYSTNVMSAQGFTAGRTGSLDKVTLAVQAANQPRDLRVSIHTSEADGTAGAELGFGTIAASAAPSSSLGIRDITMTTPAAVTQGTTYVIVAELTTSADDDSLWWMGLSYPPTYEGGRWTYVYNGSWLTEDGDYNDAYFATWVK